jgi:hypothetical protein
MCKYLNFRKNYNSSLIDYIKLASPSAVVEPALAATIDPSGETEIVQSGMKLYN